MQLGVLSIASHDIYIGTMFSVYYRPRMSPSEFLIPYNEYMSSVKNKYSIGLRMSPSEFLIPYNEYMSSVKNKYSIGLRFRMKFEGEECPKQSFSYLFSCDILPCD
ncbi:hypothetical protein MKX03_021139 [Papaver bracteatum]|nr:hypothetical protein MKX03_021139 [Papaver bracteatum]